MEIISFGLVDGNGNELVEKKEYWLVSKPVNGQIRWWKKNGSKLSYGYLNLETGEESETGRLSSDYAKSMIKDIKKSNRATWMQKKKTRKRAIIGAVIGAACMAVGSVITNYFIVYPVYTAFMPMETIIAMYQAILPSIKNGDLLSCLVIFNMPFTFVKAMLSVVITLLIYKPLSPIIHGE